MNPNYPAAEGNLTLDDFAQYNAERLSKFHFTPKMNPRLRCIKEEEHRFMQISVVSIDSDSPKNKQVSIKIWLHYRWIEENKDDEAMSENSEVHSENFNESELTEFWQSREGTIIS